MVREAETTPGDDQDFITANFFVDADHPAVVAYTEANSVAGEDDLAAAVRLYYAVRDGFRYNPWCVDISPEAFKASAVLERERATGGHCIDKANVLAACARARGIPSRLHFANVRNHIGTADLERLLGTDILVFHGYAELHLEGKWVAATPAFNKELCEHLGVEALEFNGREDSIFQQFDRKGGRFMEYLHDYGAHPGIPYDLMVAEWRRYYPAFKANDGWPKRPAG